MAILRIKDRNGTFIEVPAIIGPKGEKGDSANLDERLYNQTNDSKQNVYSCDYVNKELFTTIKIIGKAENQTELPIVVAPGTSSQYPEGTVRDDIKINSCYLVGNQNLMFRLDEDYQWKEMGIQPDMSQYLTEADKEGLITREEYIEAMIERPTFEQANQMIDRAIYEAEDVRVLKYVGHFADKGSLPFPGQKSGILTDYQPYTLTQNFTNTSFDINKIRAIVSEPYFIGYYASDTDYSLIGFTDKSSLKEIKFIPWVNRMSTTSRTSNIAIIEVNIAGSATNTIKLYSYRSTQGSKKNICYKNVDTNGEYEEYAPKAINFNAEIYLFKVTNLCSNVTGTIFKHTLDKNGWLEPYYVGDPGGHSSEYKKELVLQFANNFVYAENMAMLKFDANCQPVWLTTEGEAEINDIVSYGDRMDHCRFNGETWTDFGIPSAEIFSYVDNAIEELRNELTLNDSTEEEIIE